MSLDLPCDAAAASLARQFVERAVIELYGRRGVRQLIEDAQLIASEFVANAVLAGCEDLLLELHDAGTEAIIDLTDDAEGWPHTVDVAPTDVRGRGLHIVEAVSIEWGVEPVPGGGKHVWAALPAPRRLSLV